MKIALVQMDIAWADPEANTRKAQKLILSTPGADLYLLPEMFSTGFATEPEGIAEQEPCQSVEWMKATAARTGAAIAGSIALHAGDGSYRNRFYFVRPDGGIEYYDKHNLFTPSGEDKHFTAGEDKVIINYMDKRLRLIVCYDLRFPSWCENVGRKEYDALLCVASWPGQRRPAWEALLHGRAVDNGCVVIGVDRVGDDPFEHYSGGSLAADSLGNTLVRCEDEKEDVRIVTI